MRARISLPLLSLLIATALWAAFGAVAVVNYDTLYAMLWGKQLLAGGPIDFAAPAAPTPHPLLTLAGAISAPLVGGASGPALSLVAFAGYASTAACAVLLTLVAKRSLLTGAGVLAAILLLTREPVLSYGVRAYLDLPYLALLLAALALELDQPRRGPAVLGCLLLAGLLRPEAWLLSGAYLVWLWSANRSLSSIKPWWIVLTLAAPVLWALTDLLLTGDPLFSFSGTRAGTERLERPTGASALVDVAPRRIGEILRWELLLGAAAGTVLLAWRGRTPQVRLLLGGVVVLTASLAAVALGGLPVIVRYLLPLGAFGCLACAHALTGWRAESSIPGGRVWAAGAALLTVAIVLLAPAQWQRLDRLQSALSVQEQTIDELRFLVSEAPCAPFTVPNHRAVPLVALWREVRAGDVRTSQLDGAPREGTYFVPVNAKAANAFVLDARDRKRVIPPVPSSFEVRARGHHWVMASRCTR